MAAFGYPPKLKSGLELAFDAHFLPDCSLFHNLSIDKVTISYLFPSQDMLLL